MNIIQQFTHAANQAAEKGQDNSNVLSQRDQIFREKIVPKLVERKANDAAITHAREKWNAQTDQVMQSVGLLPKAGQSSRSFAKDQRAERAIKEAAKTGSKLPILKETALSAAETIGNSFGQGVGSMIESAAGFVADIGENNNGPARQIANYGKDLRQGYQDSASTTQKEIQSGSQGKAAQLATGAIQSVPAMALPFLGSAGTAATAAKLGIKSAPYLGLGVGAVLGHTQNYGEVRRGATEGLERDFPTWEKLQNNPLYQQKFQEKLDSGIGIDKARQVAHAETLDQLSEDKADVYGAAMTALDFIAPSGAVLGSGILKNAPTSKVGQALVGGGVSSELVKKQLQQAPRVGLARLMPDVSKASNIAAAKMIGKQGLEEGLQGAIGSYGSQSASADIGGTPVSYKDIGQSFIEEGIMGAVMGGGMQTASRQTPTHQAKNVAKQLRSGSNRLREEEAKARQELAQAIELGNPEAISEAQSNLGNIGAEAVKVRDAYMQYGAEAPHFVNKHADAFTQRQESAKAEAEQQAQAEEQQQANEQAQANPVDPSVNPNAVDPNAAQATPQPKPEPTPTNEQMAETTNIVMDSLHQGLIDVDEANAIQSNPIHADVFKFSRKGDKVAAHNIVINAVSMGNLDFDLAQGMIQSIDRYADMGKPRKPSLSGIVNDFVKKQVHPEDDLFNQANATDLDPETFEPIQQAESGILEGDVPETIDPIEPVQAIPNIVDPVVTPVTPTATPKAQDFNKPKAFTNYVKANDFVKTNNLKETHEIIKSDDGLVTVQPKAVVNESVEQQHITTASIQGKEEKLPDLTETMPVSDYVKDHIKQHRQIADNLDVTQDIEDLAAQGLVASEIYNTLKDTKLSGFKQRSDALELVRATRTSLGIPSREQGEEAQNFDIWLKDYQARKNQDTTAEPIAEASVESSSFTDKIRDAHINNPKIKPKLINDEIALGRPRAEVLQEVSDIVKSIQAPIEPQAKQTEAPAQQAEPQQFEQDMPIVGNPAENIETKVETVPVEQVDPPVETQKEQKTTNNGIQQDSQDVGRASDGKPFANQPAAKTMLKKKGLEDTHDLVQVGPSQFVLRPKSVEQVQAENKQEIKEESKQPTGKTTETVEETQDIQTTPESVERIAMPEKVSLGIGQLKTTPINNTVYRETNLEGFEGLVRDTLLSGGSTRSVFVTDNIDLAIGQYGNKGILIQFRGDAVSGKEHKKPIPGELTGREYKTDFISIDSIDQFILPKDTALRSPTRRGLQGKFDYKTLGDESILATRKGFNGQPLNEQRLIESALEPKTTEQTPSKTTESDNPSAAPQESNLDFPMDDIINAYSHAHLSPRNTALVFKEGYDKFIQNEADTAQAFVKTPEQQTALDQAIKETRESYINDALPPLLRSAKSTVSSARAGGSNFNSKQANKRGDALDRATDQFYLNIEKLKGQAKRAVLNARTAEQKDADHKAEVEEEARKLEKQKLNSQKALEKLEQLKAEEKANKKRASNQHLGSPEGAEQMTAAEWRAKHKDAKAVIDGVRYVMKLVNGATSLVPVWITDEKGTTTANPLKVGNTITFSRDFDYATANRPYSIITSTKAKLTLEHDGSRLSIERKILDIELTKDPELYSVEEVTTTTKTQPQAEAPQANNDKSYESVRRQFDDLVKRIDDGEQGIQVAEVQQTFSDMFEHIDAITAEYNSKTKAELLASMNPFMAQRLKSENKPEIVNRWVNNVFRSIDFVESGVITMSWNDKRSVPEVIRDKLKNATQEQLDKHLESQRKAHEEYLKQKAEDEAGINDPKTLNDFNNIYQQSEHNTFIDFYRSLTLPQQALYDELKSTENNEQRLRQIEQNKAYQEASRPSQAVSSSTDATLYAGKHTKKGTDIWTIALNGRVEGDAFNEIRSKAKALGGYYSSYKGGGAVPGFIFDNEESAKQLLDEISGESQAQNAVDGQEEALPVDPNAEAEVFESDAKKHADKLREKSQTIIERGEENINRDRKTNTAKRAGEARRAEEQANHQIFLGETLNRIADGIENGTVKYLNRIGALTQLRNLESLLQQASYEQERETKAKERVINATTIPYLEYPQYKLSIDNFKRLVKDLAPTKPSLSKRLNDLIDWKQNRDYENWLNEKNEFGTENYVSMLAKTTTGSVALFKTSITKAEAMAKRANASSDVPKFQVLKIKNGEYAVVSSFQRAMEENQWKPTNQNNQMIVGTDLGDQIFEALKQRQSKDKSYSINWVIEHKNEESKRMRKLEIHDPSTFRAMMREYLDLRSKEKGTDPIKEMERSMIGRTKDGLDFFPTPRAVVEQMIELADLNPEMKVLEPSAGMGHIADILKEYGVKPDVIELSGQRQELLKLKGYSVVGNDFLMFDPSNRSPNYGDVFKTKDGQYQGVMRGSGSLGSSRVRLMRESDGQMITYFDRDDLELVKMNGTKYDRIIMNPPFSDRRDSAHIYHAFDLLADDGVLVAIAGEGVFFGKDAKAKEFQDWLDQVGAEVTPLEAGVFNDPNLPVNTSVKARIVTIHKSDSKGKQFSRREDLSRSTEQQTKSNTAQIRETLVSRFGESVIQELERNGILNIVPNYHEKGVEGFAENGRVTLVADAITAENIVPVFLHELGGHVGFQGVMKPVAYDVLMKEFNRLVKSGNAEAIEAKRLAERESDAEVQADEYLPYLVTVSAQNQAKQGSLQKLVNRILSAVKAWAVDKLSLDLKLNPSDILALSERMVKQVAKGKPPTPPKGGKRYSRSSNANPQDMSRSRQREFLDSAAKSAFGQMALLNMERAKTIPKQGIKLFQTMLHKALTDEKGEFKKTFDLVQDKINHVTFASSVSMDVAPDILTQLETWQDFSKEVKRVGRQVASAVPGSKVKQTKVDTDLKKVGDLLLENTLLENSERHTDRELRQLGFDEDQINIYHQAREAIDSSLDTFAKTTLSNIYKHLGGTTAEVLEMASKDGDITDHYNEILKRIDQLTKGIPEKAEARQAAIEAIDKVYKKVGDLKDHGYVPLMRFGKYFVRIFNPTTGEVAYRQHFESEAERNRYFEDHKGDDFQPGFEIEKSQINELEHKMFQGVSPETVALFAKESGLPIGDAETAYIKYAIRDNHALKRLLKRQGIDGFDTDFKRVLASFVLSNARYSANQTYNPAIDESIQDISDPQYQEDAIRLRDYSLDTQEELSAVKNFAFVWYMGYSFMFGLVNLTQPLLQTLPYLMQYSKNHAGITGSAFLKAIKTWRNGPETMDDKYKPFYERARREGHLDPQNTWMLQGLERGKSGLGASGWQLFSHASGFFAQASETVNRRTTLFASLDVAESLGSEKLKELGFKDEYDFAIRTIQETQGIYNKGNRPRVSRGNIGSVVMMYKQFMIAYIEQMVRMQKSGLYGGEDDEFKRKMKALVGFGISRSVLAMLGVLMAFSGATGLPFMRDILDGVETVGGMIGKPVNTEREIQIALHTALGQAAGQTANTILMDGLFNVLPGIDVKGRMGMGDLIPATAYFSPTTSEYMKGSEVSQTWGAMGGLVEKAKESMELAQVGAYGLAGTQLLPKAITSMGQGAVAATTGDYRNMKTGVKTNDATVTDGIIKMLDAQPSSIAKQGRVRGLEMKDKSIQQYVNKRWKEDFNQALESGNGEKVREIQQQIKDYNANNPRYPITFNQKTAVTNFKKSNQNWQEKRKDTKGLEWMDNFNPYLDEE